MTSGYKNGGEVAVWLRETTRVVRHFVLCACDVYILEAGLNVKS